MSLCDNAQKRGRKITSDTSGEGEIFCFTVCRVRGIILRFGFDIDDTLIDLRGYAFQLYNKKLNQNVGLDVFQADKDDTNS